VSWPRTGAGGGQIRAVPANPRTVCIARRVAAAQAAAAAATAGEAAARRQYETASVALAHAVHDDDAAAEDVEASRAGDGGAVRRRTVGVVAGEEEEELGMAAGSWPAVDVHAAASPPAPLAMAAVLTVDDAMLSSCGVVPPGHAVSVRWRLSSVATDQEAADAARAVAGWAVPPRVQPSCCPPHLPCDRDFIAVYRLRDGTARAHSGSSDVLLRAAPPPLLFSDTHHHDLAFTDAAAEGEAKLHLPNTPDAYVVLYVHHRGGVVWGQSVPIVIAPFTLPSGAQHSLLGTMPSGQPVASVVELHPSIHVYSWTLRLPSAHPAAVVLRPGFSPPAGWRPALLVESERAGATRVTVQISDPGSRSPALLLHASVLLLDRIDTAACALFLARDHISVRLPQFYKPPPTRHTSARPMVTAAEIAAWRAGASPTCRACLSPLMRLPPHPAALGVHLLPSDAWMEWSDMWLCHEDDRSLCLPAESYGAMRGVVLVGQHTVQVHAADVAPGALRAHAEPDSLCCGRCGNVIARGLVPPTSAAAALPSRLGEEGVGVVTLMKQATSLWHTGGEGQRHDAHARYTGHSIAVHTIASVAVEEGVSRFALVDADAPYATDVCCIDILTIESRVAGTASVADWGAAADGAVALQPALKVRMRMVGKEAAVADTAPLRMLSLPAAVISSMQGEVRRWHSIISMPPSSATASAVTSDASGSGGVVGFLSLAVAEFGRAGGGK